MRIVKGLAQELLTRVDSHGVHRDPPRGRVPASVAVEEVQSVVSAVGEHGEEEVGVREGAEAQDGEGAPPRGGRSAGEGHAEWRAQCPPEDEIRGGSDVPPQELWDYDSSALAKGLRGSSSSLSLSLLPSTSVS